jgi:Coenzyme PQQ synthesis protein D (PqqD)
MEMEASGRPSCFEISDDVLFQPVEDEAVLLSLTSQRYYSLNAVGAHIWHLLRQERDMAAVADRLCEEYDVEPNTALRDVESIIENLQAAGLLRMARRPASAVCGSLDVVCGDKTGQE